jgi:hypothetical protein
MENVDMTTMRQLIVAVLAIFLLSSLACGQQPSTQSPVANDQTTASGPGGSESLDIVMKTDPDPVRTGQNTFEVVVRDRGKPVTDANVSTELFMAAMPSMNMPEMRQNANLAHEGEGVYRGVGQVMMAGSWDVTVKVMREGREIGRKKMTITAR